MPKTLNTLRLLLLVGLFFIGLVTYGYFQATPGVENQTENRPEILIEPKLFNFGEVEYGQVLESTFIVKNKGNNLLEIKRVSTSCGCTTAKIKDDKLKIEKGEEAELLVSYDTGAMTGSHAKGNQERIIYIQSNDPEKPQVEVTIYASVK